MLGNKIAKNRSWLYVKSSNYCFFSICVSPVPSIEFLDYSFFFCCMKRVAQQTQHILCSAPMFRLLPPFFSSPSIRARSIRTQFLRYCCNSSSADYFVFFCRTRRSCLSFSHHPLFFPTLSLSLSSVVASASKKRQQCFAVLRKGSTSQHFATLLVIVYGAK